MQNRREQLRSLHLVLGDSRASSASPTAGSTQPLMKAPSRQKGERKGQEKEKEKEEKEEDKLMTMMMKRKNEKLMKNEMEKEKLAT